MPLGTADELRLLAGNLPVVTGTLTPSDMRDAALSSDGGASWRRPLDADRVWAGGDRHTILTSATGGR